MLYNESGKECVTAFPYRPLPSRPRWADNLLAKRRHAAYGGPFTVDPRRISHGPWSHDVLDQLRRAHPAVEVRVREDDITNLLATVYTVRHGKLAAAISALPDTRNRKPPPDLCITELASDGACHQATSRDQIPLTQLQDEPMVALVGSVRGA